MALVIYHLWTAIPELAEHASKAYLFQEPSPGHVWKDWVLEARDMFWKTLAGLILRVCFYFVVALWSFAETTEKRTENLTKPETADTD